ncbi:hypothetical protein HZA97_07165 [Candidatus Woesearchaeota archaeon]|nr:hypothetical protein [Candidatus Woesearchaeota archaeon]
MNFREILFFNFLFACFYSGITVLIVTYSTKQLDLFSVLILGLFGIPLLTSFLFFFPNLKSEKRTIVQIPEPEFFENSFGGGKNEENIQDID